MMSHTFQVLSVAFTEYDQNVNKTRYLIEKAILGNMWLMLTM